MALLLLAEIKNKNQIMRICGFHVTDSGCLDLPFTCPYSINYFCGYVPILATGGMTHPMNTPAPSGSESGDTGPSVGTYIYRKEKCQSRAVDYKSNMGLPGNKFKSSVSQAFLSLERPHFLFLFYFIPINRTSISPTQSSAGGVTLNTVIFPQLTCLHLHVATEILWRTVFDGRDVRINVLGFFFSHLGSVTLYIPKASPTLGYFQI